MQVEALDHIHVHGSDPDASAAFYTEHFGATVVQRHEDGPSVLIALGGKILIFSPLPEGVTAGEPPGFAGGAYTNGYGIAHFGLRVADVVGAVDELAAAGVSILGKPQVEPGLTVAYVGAPDGVVIELTQYDVPAG